MKNMRLVVVGAGAVLIAVGFIIFSSANTKPVGKCGPYRNDKTVTVAGAKFTAEAVTTKKEQSTGLSGRPCIEADQTMLFIFDRPGQYAIWMKDMKFPIDVLWADPNGKVVGVERNIQPSTYPDSFANKEKNAVYVIEMKANRSQELKVGLGTKVQIQ